MKRAIIVRFVAVLLLALAMSSVVSYYFIGKTMLNQNMSSMRNTIHVVDYALNYDEDMQEQIARLNDTVLDPDSRITIIGADGTVYAVGKNDSGQCDVEDWQDIVYISAGDSATLGITSTGELKIAGDIGW